MNRLIIWLLVLGGCSPGSGSGSSGNEPAPPVIKTNNALPDPEGAELDTKNLVKVSLIADVDRVATGKTFTLAARFVIQPGWHIYWTNPGESGLATEVELEAPGGFQVGPARFPGPESFRSGHVQNYGYSGQVLISSQVTAPQVVAGQSLVFRLRASWLACRESCVRGRAPAILELPAAARGQKVQPANAAVMTRHDENLPRPWSELSDAKVTWSDDALTIAVPGAELELYPASEIQLGYRSQMAQPGKLEIRFQKKETPARGVLRVTRGTSVRYYEIDQRRPS